MLRTYTVFNYSCIEGVPEHTKRREHTVSMPALQEFCDEALKTMGVELNHYGDRAFYSVKDDKIVLPTKDSFETIEDYYATRLHETAHSTGAEKRLNRDLSGRFGSAEYAEEELRAEIASSILFADLHMPTEAKLLDNHKAYIQSWIEILKNDPKILFQAIKDAEKISDYIQEQAPIAREKIHQEKLQEENQQDHSKYIQEKIKDDFLNERVSEMEYRCLDEHQDWINDKFDAYKKGDSEEEKSATYETLRDAILINAGFRLIHENQEVLSSDASIMNEGIVGMGFEDEGISF